MATAREGAFTPNAIKTPPEGQPSKDSSDDEDVLNYIVKLTYIQQ